MKHTKTYTKKEILAYFDYFKNNIPNRLELAKKILKKDKLDFSMEEIDKIGEIYKNYVKEIKASGNWKEIKNPLLAEEGSHLNNGDWYDNTFEMFMTYCGEAWIYYFGGKWDIVTQKNNTTYRFPIVIKWGPKEYPWSSIDPIDWVRNIEVGYDEPLSLPWRRNLNYFKLSPEWNFNPLNKIKNE